MTAPTPIPPVRSATMTTPVPNPPTQRHHDDMHTLQIVMPMALADQLVAKAGTMDNAVHQALTAYLRTDIEARNARIKEFVAQGKSVDKLAEFHGLTPADILHIANS
jgi:hypothetical protein